MSLKYGILGLLAERPLHGYEVKNRFETLCTGTRILTVGFSRAGVVRERVSLTASATAPWLTIGTLAPVRLPERHAGERLEPFASGARPHRSQARRSAENESLGALLHRHR